jgi:hypothetical protein
MTGWNPPHPAMRKNPRLYKIREMRAEVKKLDAALAILEGQFADGRPVGRIDLRLVHGWILSLAESYVVLAYTSMAKSTAGISVQRLRDYIDSKQRPFLNEYGTTNDDPVPYYPSQIERMTDM